MAEARKCAKCGTELPTGVLGGRCPKCLGEVVFGISPGSAAAVPAAGEPESIEGGQQRAGDYAEQLVPRRAPEFEGEHLGAMIGRYKLVEKIGEGGFGVVYRAEQVEPMHREVALKIIKAGMDTREVIARFEAERQALALMDHPNIARVLDAGATGAGRPFFVMELVLGIPITDYCDQHTLSTAERLALFMKVCHGVQHAHQKGIIHRDLKPSNVLVTLQDNEPVPKVIDFGVAKALGQKLTEKTLYTGLAEMIGTPAYMSPEQARLSSLDIDTRTDIYSLGVLLYELLTGVTPFDKRTLAKAALDEILRMIRETEPLKPSTRLQALGDKLTEVARHRQTEPGALSRLVRGDLDWIVMKAMEKDPARRYESANVLALDLQHYLQHEPVLATPPSVGYLAGKFARRNRVPVLVAGVVAMALALGLSAALVELRRAQRAEVNEKGQRQRAEQLRVAAEESARETRQRLVRVNIANGARLLQEGDSVGSLPWFVEALKLEQGDSRREEIHRLRLASILKQSPILLQCWFHAGPVNHAEFSPEGRRVLTASADGTARVWDTTSGSEVAVVKHQAAVNFAAFNSDGRRIATAGADGAARVWDAATGEPVTPWLQHTGNVNRALFSPDGRRVVSASDDTTVRLWDAATGEPALPPLRHGGRVQDVAFSPDNRYLASIGLDRWGRGVAFVWDAATGRLVTSMRPRSSRVYSVTFSSDSRRVLMGTWGEARLCDVETGRDVVPAMTNAQAIPTAVFSPHGRWILTACEDRMARIWDAATGQQLGVPLKHPYSLNDAEFSPYGQWIVTASNDGTARVWDAMTGEAVGPPLKHSSRIVCARFSPDGTRVLTAGAEGMTRLWDVATPGLEMRTLRHKSRVIEVSTSPDGQRVLTLSWDGTAQVWDAATGKPFPVNASHNDAVTDADFSPDRTRFVTASADHTASVWDSATGVRLATFKHNGPVVRARFTPDGQRVRTAYGGYVRLSWRGTLEIAGGPFRIQSWNPTNGALIGTNLSLEDSCWVVEFSHDTSRVVTISPNRRTWRLWDASSGQPLTPPVEAGGPVICARFSPDDRQLVTAAATVTGAVTVGSGEGEARVWDVTTGRSVTPPLKHKAGVLVAAFSSDGQRVVTGSRDGTARVWSIATGEALTPPLVHTGHVIDANFNPDGRLVITGSDDHMARIWDATTGEPATAPMEHRSQVLRALFSPDGERILTALYQGATLTDIEPTAHVWDLPRDDRPVADLEIMAKLLSAHRIDATGSLVPLEKETLAELWQTAPAKYPAHFSTATNRLRDWHCEQFKVCEQAGQLSLALRHLQALREIQPQDATLNKLLTRSHLRLNSSGELERGRPALALAARDPQAKPNLIDLSAHYNASLEDSWQDSELIDNDLAILPHGLKTLAGVEFDVRGLIQLSGLNLSPPARPIEVRGIKVGRLCAKLHFLHAALGNMPDHTPIGRYFIHYADGWRKEIPILYADHLRDWVDRGEVPPSAGGTVVAWTGQTARNRIRLFKTTWENPLPGVEIDSLDFSTKMTPVAPFLIAVTAEP